MFQLAFCKSSLFWKQPLSFAANIVLMSILGSYNCLQLHVLPRAILKPCFEQFDIVWYILIYLLVVFFTGWLFKSTGIITTRLYLIEMDSKPSVWHTWGATDALHSIARTPGMWSTRHLRNNLWRRLFNFLKELGLVLRKPKPEMSHP